MKLAEFAALVSENPRQIRYLISEGFMPAPDGISSAASYGPRHEEAVRSYQKLRAEGRKPAEIKQMIARHPRVDEAFSPGVRLVIDPAVAGWTQPDPQVLAAWVEDLVKIWLRGSSGEDADANQENKDAF